MKLFLKTNKYFISLFLLLLFFIFIAFYIYNLLENKNSQILKLENSFKVTKDIISLQKRYAQSLSILLSSDTEIVNAYRKKDKTSCYEVIQKKILSLKNYQNTKIEIQVHNKDLTTFLRSWDLDAQNNPISFRKGVLKVKETKKAYVAIELGKRLNIKAISPIIYKDEYIGSLEVIIDFSFIEKELRQKGLDFYVLLDKKYLNIATELSHNPLVKDYVIVNKKNISNLDGLSFKNLKEYGYINNEKYSFVYFRIFDYENRNLGYILSGFYNDFSSLDDKHFDIVDLRDKK